MTGAGGWAGDVLGYWFGELDRADWFRKDEQVDAQIRQRFLATHEAVAAMPVQQLLADQDTALAAIIALDQFPRNLFRGTPRAFLTDALALSVATGAVGAGLDQRVPVDRRVFVYLPFEHSENWSDQQRSMELIAKLSDPEYARYAETHAEVIRRFGRFPHRNAILGRQSTAEELAYLAEPGSGF